MRRLVALVGAVVFLDTMFFTALAPLLPHYADDLDLSKTGAGVLAGAYPAGVLVGGIPSGILATRIGVKRTLLAGLLCLAATTLTFGFANTAGLLVAARFVQGVGSACAWTAGFTWLVGAASPERRGAMIGSALGVAIAGALFGPVLGAVASVIGTAPAFSFVAALAVALAAWAVRSPAPPPREPQPLRELARATRAPVVLVGLWLILLPALAFGSLSVLAPLRLHDLGLGSVAIGVVYLISAAGESALAPVVGRVSDRHGRLFPLRIGLVASAAVAAILPWPNQQLVLAAVVILAGSAFGIFWAPAMAWLFDAADDRGLEAAYAFALINLAWAPGQAGGAVIGAALAQATSDAVPYLLLSALCLVTLAGLREAGAIQPVRPPA